MQKNNVYIYWSKVEGPLSAGALEGSFLSARLRQRYRHYRTDMQRYLSMLGKLLLAYGLDDLQLRGRRTRLNLEYYPNGKPYLLKPPVPFSLSHSGHLVVCAISPDHTIGIDVQKQLPLRAGSERIFLNPAEIAQFPAETYLDLWCQKEAAYKAMSHWPGARMTEFRFMGPHLLIQGEWAVRTYPLMLDEGFLACVALPAGAPWRHETHFVPMAELLNVYEPHGEGVGL